MKKHKKKSNNRWKWMAGATAATAAGVTASQASTITINLTNNYISATGGNNLNADLTGDGQPDVEIAGASNTVNFFYAGSGRYTAFRAGVTLNGVRAFAFYENFFRGGILALGSRSIYTPSFGYYLSGSIPIFFQDLHINGGAPTNGSLEVTLFNPSDALIRLESFTYNTPDQGSSLALLAMGASGVLALRRWRAAQGGS